jgi:hypothetical protein
MIPVIAGGAKQSRIRDNLDCSYVLLLLAMNERMAPLGQRELAASRIGAEGKGTNLALRRCPLVS